MTIDDPLRRPQKSHAVDGIRPHRRRTITEAEQDRRMMIDSMLGIPRTWWDRTTAEEQ